MVGSLGGALAFIARNRSFVNAMPPCHTAGELRASCCWPLPPLLICFVLKRLLPSWRPEFEMKASCYGRRRAHEHAGWDSTRGRAASRRACHGPLNAARTRLTGRRRTVERGHRAARCRGDASGYGAMEAALERIARAMEGLNPSTDRWHQHLLAQMFLPMLGLRPAVIPEELRPALRELLGFRHLLRHAYATIHMQRISGLSRCS